VARHRPHEDSRRRNQRPHVRRPRPPLREGGITGGGGARF